ncbi:hypothetical protein [Fulvivirga ligni]|uniref:hypothetical protein n=1 Tax=Fulvivirga ligni TaxID=2904246 RepID=UPI001F362E2C|nr:hypothetical protein [Fulvivirga ligni]UII21547.1 hypothetical protein LVD16_27345 [Fulvivirga ligni]
MQDSSFDLKGVVILCSETISGRIGPIHAEYWGQGGINPEVRQDSCLLQLIGRDYLFPGESCKAYFRFKFLDHPHFQITVNEKDIIQLFEGGRKLGGFKVEEVLNDKLRQ